jgi:hypothetical protein
MTAIWCLIGMTVGVVLAAAVAVWRRGFSGSQFRLQRARGQFHLRREWLEARFLSLVSESGKPHELIWSDCDFDDEVVFATDRETGQLRAFAAVTLCFGAEPAGDADDASRVGHLRVATAIFQYARGQWQTDGRAVFNLNPLETVERFQCHLQSVE